MNAARHVPQYSCDDDLFEALHATLGARMLDGSDESGEIVFYVERDAIADSLRDLRDHHEYQQLMEIAGADYPNRSERFEVVYMLLSLTKNHRIIVKVKTDEDTPVPSVTGLWPNAGWLEREVFDLYGVAFAGNPDLRRILTDYGFEGHPLRKDFPQTGYVELRYSEAEKRVVYEPVRLPQDFRNFDFLMPWEGPEYRLPGDEKAEGQTAAAPSPAPAPGGPTKVQATPPPPSPKTTETTAQTGAGAPADAVAKREARKPAGAKANNAGGKASKTREPKPGKGK